MIKSNSITEVKEFLENHPGYIKWGKNKLAVKFDCEIDDIVKIKDTLKHQSFSKPTYHLPRILVFDIETAPLKAFVWGRWKQNIYLDQTISEWYMLTWSAKWLNGDTMMSEGLTSEEALAEDDKRITTDFWNLLDEADMVIAHNGDKFDIPKINSRFILNGLLPPSTYQQIDTLKIARKQFGFSSNKLDALATYFGVENKIKTEMQLWVDCVAGDSEALTNMRIYNEMDVTILEKVYLKLRPYIKNHPNVTLYDDSPINHRCPTCGADTMVEDKFYYTTVGKFQVYRCTNCGALSRSRKCIKRGVVTGNVSLGK